MPSTRPGPGAPLLLRGAAHLFTGLPGAEMRRAGPRHDIRIRDGRVAAIGVLEPSADESVLDIDGCVVYPGWVNTHHHLFQGLLKGVPDGIDAALVRWLAAVPVAYRPGLDREDRFRLAVRIGLVELLRSGCTTVADHQYHLHPELGFDPAAVLFDEAGRLGLRLVLCQGGQTIARAMTDDHAPPSVRPVTLDRFLSTVADAVARFHDPSPRALRRVASAITTPTWSCRPQELAVLAREARALGIRLHSHLSETFDYVRWAREVHGCTPLAFVERHGWVGPDVWFAHMVHLDDDELRRCAETGTGIAHCPQSNARLGSGIARIPEALELGVPVGLAVDGAASNEAADMLSEAHACWLMHRADPRAGPRERLADAAMARHSGRRGRVRTMQQAGGDASAMTVDDVVHIGTAGGARLLGLEGVGTLAVGQAADLAVYDLRADPRFFGLHDPGMAPVVSGGRPRLRAVLVDGHLVLQDDQIPGLDLETLQREAADAVRALRRPH
jgi:8-oxoguanine deaminase